MIYSRLGLKGFLAYTFVLPRDERFISLVAKLLYYQLSALRFDDHKHGFER